MAIKKYRRLPRQGALFLTLLLVIVTAANIFFALNLHHFVTIRRGRIFEPKAPPSVAIVTILNSAELSEGDGTKSQDGVTYIDSYFRGLVRSFCQTASTGPVYTFYLGVVDGRNMLPGVKITTVFNETVRNHCHVLSRPSLRLMTLKRDSSTAVIDIMRHAFLRNEDYYLLASPTVKFQRKGWSERYIKILSRLNPPNVGAIFSDRHESGLHSFLFVHRTHFDIFGSFYIFNVRHFGALWLREVYGSEYIVFDHVETASKSDRLSQSIPRPRDHNLRFFSDVIVENKEQIKTWIDHMNVKQNPKLVISFSLHGNQMRYTYGAIRNAQLARIFYPKWTPRFYISGQENSFPGNYTIQHLKRLGADLIFMGKSKQIALKFQRFLPGDEYDLEAYIVRDCDSRLSQREANLVDSWLNSNASFHCIRDHPAHVGHAILAGMFGAKPYQLRRYLNKSWLELVTKSKEGYYDDQTFLANEIWPNVSSHSLCHDSVSCRRYVNALPITEKRKNYFHIGAVFNEYDQIRESDALSIKNNGESKECTT